MTLGGNVHARRLELGMSQRELAEAAGYRTRSAVAKIESGQAEPTVSKLIALAEALDTSAARLLSGVGAPQGPEGRAPAGGGGFVVLVLAGGTSTRNGLSSPTQFAGVLGRPVVSYILEAYQRDGAASDIYAVAPAGWEGVLRDAAARCGASKLRAVVPGGATGLESVRAGVRRIVADGHPMGEVVVVHESARPLVDGGAVRRLVRSCERAGSSVVCEPLADHLAFRRGPGGAMEYVDRDSLYSMQSPDAHRLGTLVAMFEEAEARGVALSENCCGMLLTQLGWPLAFVEGARGNIKVTRREDLAVLASLLGRL